MKLSTNTPIHSIWGDPDFFVIGLTLLPLWFYKSELEIFKVSVRNHSSCGIIKKRKIGEVMRSGGDHTNWTYLNS